MSKTKKTQKRTTSFHLEDAFAQLQRELLTDLGAGDLISHPTTKGTNAELNWQKMLRNFLPKRYQVDSAYVVDVNGAISDQIDLVVYDAQYSPLLFKHEGGLYLPAESVYAVFEVKPTLDKAHLEYAGDKAASVRRLERTSAPVIHAGGAYEPVQPKEIIGGLLARRSGWARPAAKLQTVLGDLSPAQRIDLGCGIESCAFDWPPGEEARLCQGDSALLFFALRLFRRLQRIGTVPAIDIDRWGPTAFGQLDPGR